MNNIRTRRQSCHAARQRASRTRFTRARAEVGLRVGDGDGVDFRRYFRYSTRVRGMGMGPAGERPLHTTLSLW